MLKLSKKGETLPASPIRKLVPFSENAKKEGVKVYHLNIGQPDIQTPECALEAVKNIDTKIIAYTHSAGNLSYREALADFYSTATRNILPEDIIVTTGGSEAIIFTIMATCDQDDEIIIPEPYYANYNSFATEVGAEIVPVATYIEDGFSLPSIQEIEKKITPRTKAIMICNPNNPTGYLYTQEELLRLQEVVEKHGIYL
ncbi:MAG: aminotransferase class I/II-fold pyridoxal phosphate-dependent enzyme, partial [Rikenellaceae bacterium]